MSITVKNIIPPKQAEASQTTQYTAVNCKAIIDKFTATNTSGSNVTISVNLVASGGSASPTNQIVSSRAIAPNETYCFPELIGQVVERSGFISTVASSATALTISASGREIV